MQNTVKVYDTTLRDGTQAEDFNLTVGDKIRIALALDKLGFDYIEGGWPGSNPKDIEFFRDIRNYDLKHAKTAAFGSTHHAGHKPEDDPNLKALVEAQTPVITIFGKSWTVHVKEALRITLKRNLEIITHSLAFLKPHCQQLFYDAEHFFDGFKADPDYAFSTLLAAIKGGAECLVLCDTNGGNIPSTISAVIKDVQSRLSGVGKNGFPLGIHAHDDTECAVANSLAAVECGAVQVQGTMNGIGERCGNANLCSIVPNLAFKMDIETINAISMQSLKSVSRLVSELGNVPPGKYQPYVGRSAFAHKGGVHVCAVERNPETYEHVDPARIGNKRRFPASDLSGKATVKRRARDAGIDLEGREDETLSVLNRLKELENAGYSFDAAEASFELLLMKGTGQDQIFFDLIGFRVNDLKLDPFAPSICEASIRIKVCGEEEHTAALGKGPVNALDNALRKALVKFYPELRNMELADYKVRVLDGNANGTAARVRVWIESKNGKTDWRTVGVSEDIIEASWQALVDSYTYFLIRKRAHPPKCA
jgi:2-isopropylmalate synthase